MPGFLWRVLKNAMELAAVMLYVVAVIVIILAVIATVACVAVATYMYTGSDIWAAAAVAAIIIISVAVMEEVL